MFLNRFVISPLTALFALFLVFGIAAASPVGALAMPNCADVFRVSFNQQAIIQANTFTPGSPSTVTIAGKTGIHFFVGDEANGSNSFQVVVNDELGYVNPGDIVYKPFGQQIWSSKSTAGVVSYKCVDEGLGKVDEFALTAKANCSFPMTDGTSLVSDCVDVKATRLNAFRLRDDVLGDEFFVVAQHSTSFNSLQGGSVLIKSPEQQGKFVVFYAYSTGKEYAGVPYYGCCTEPLATAVPGSFVPSPSSAPWGASVTPTSTATATASATETLVPTATEVPTATPTPYVAPSTTVQPTEPPKNPDSGFPTSGLLFILAAIIIVALAYFVLTRFGAAGVQVRKEKPGHRRRTK